MKVKLANDTYNSLMEDFEALARSVRSSEAAHTFAEAQGVTVVWNSPLSRYRPSVVQAALSHDPNVLPKPGARFLTHVDRLRCEENVLAPCKQKVAYTQRWSMEREGQFERYSFVRTQGDIEVTRAEFVFDRRRMAALGNGCQPEVEQVLTA